MERYTITIEIQAESEELDMENLKEIAADIESELLEYIGGEVAVCTSVMKRSNSRLN